MAERLTRNNKVNFCFHDEASNMVYYKLAQLEDIMEKYNIESAEILDRLINVWKLRDVVDKMEEPINNLYKQSGCLDLEKDRDTWKRACELACEKIVDMLGDCPIETVNWQQEDDWCEENCDKHEKLLCWDRYFYQQAKKGR